MYFFDTLNNLLIYFNTALGISVLLNIPKFFEAETSVSYEINASGENVTNTRIGISDIRIHPSYITYYTMWTRLLATGIFPLGTIHILRKHFEGGRGRQKIASFAYFQIVQKLWLCRMEGVRKA
jgi:hypothetical protein